MEVSACGRRCGSAYPAVPRSSAVVGQDRLVHARSWMWSGALIRSDDEVLLVRQQGRDGAAEDWAVPGGVVEHGELAVDAMIREIGEETGLMVTDPGRLVVVSQYQIRHPEWGGAWTAFMFEPTTTGQITCADPDRLVTEAAWLPVDVAVTRLAALQFPPMRDPAIHRLRQPITAAPVLWSWPGAVYATHPVLLPAT
jgi:8-oxo-dGTP diphosphatase